MGFLGTSLGLIIGVAIIVLIIYFKVRSIVGKTNLEVILKRAKNSGQQEYTREKYVGGMTKIIEPNILRDFSDFNKELLYSKVEQNLVKIFNCIEEKSIKNIQNDNDLIYIIPALKEKIVDMKGNNINIRYDNVEFHAHAIKSYLKTEGKATIVISSTLGYYYSDDSSSNNEKFKSLKRQTRYTTEFVYVYDETKFKPNENVFSISCPNCGAPLTNLGAENCSYCGIHIEHINLKSWYMISYNEDYKW